MIALRVVMLSLVATVCLRSTWVLAIVRLRVIRMMRLRIIISSRRIILIPIRE